MKNNLKIVSMHLRASSAHLCVTNCDAELRRVNAEIRRDFSRSVSQFRIHFHTFGGWTGKNERSNFAVNFKPKNNVNIKKLVLTAPEGAQNK